MQVSWCKLEVKLASPKQILSDKHLSAAAASRAPPPLTVASLSLKTVINSSSHQNEIVAASVVHLQGVNMEVRLVAGVVAGLVAGLVAVAGCSR